MSCEKCKLLVSKSKDPSKRIPNCKECGLVEIMPENYLTFGLIEKYSGILINDGVIKPEGIKLMLDIENIPNEDRPEIVQKIIISLYAAVQSMRAK